MSLPPDLSRLGDHLERAADRAVARRRRRWAARTAVAGATLACLAAGLAPESLAPAVRGPAQPIVAAATPPRCADVPGMRREPCVDAPALVTDAAAGPDSPAVVAHQGDASQSGLPGPLSRAGGQALY